MYRGKRLVLIVLFSLIFIPFVSALPSVVIDSGDASFINISVADYWDAYDIASDIGITELTDDWGLVKKSDWTTIDDFLLLVLVEIMLKD